jgi:hypothetical protein
MAILLLLNAGTSSAQDNNPVATDPAKAGPDWQVQGEYLGQITGASKLGAEVIALGDGMFQVNLLPGGLPGEGGDYQKHHEGQAKREGDKLTITGKDNKWSAIINDNPPGKTPDGQGLVMAGKTPEGQAFELKKLIRKSKTEGKQPPAGAVVLFNGKDANAWNNGKIEAGNLLGSDIASKQKFGDHHLHLEFRLSYMPKARGQGRSNSGVYVQNRYEVQVLDSFGLKGENNECGGLYSQAAPKVNMCYPPLTWQTYDIDIKAARFDKDGKKIADGVITVRHNDVVIHDKLALKGPTPGGGKESTDPGPLFLQGHGGQVQYRNIWVVPAAPEFTNPFKDKNLEAAVKAVLQHSKGELTEQNLANVFVLEAPGKGIHDLSGLEKCKNLALLKLTKNDIVDVTALKGLENLQSLDLASNKIKDAGPLAGLKRLQYLELSDNQVSDLKPLAGLEALSALYLSGNKISDLQPLAGLKKLASLSLARNQIQNLSPLTGITRITTLDLGDNQIADLAPLKTQQELSLLLLQKNKIADLTSLVEMVKKDTEGERRFAPYLRLYIEGNPLSPAARKQLDALKGYGVRVH